MCKAIKIIVVILLLSFTPVAAIAGDFDGSKPLICAIMETFECVPDGECHRGLAETIDIPQFLRIDFSARKISGTMKGGGVRTTQIEHMKWEEGKLILQGQQKGRAWSMVINDADGKATISASDGLVGFVVFGACTTPN